MLENHSNIKHIARNSTINNNLVKPANSGFKAIKLMIVSLLLVFIGQVSAANPDATGVLRIEALNAPNFVVDSNIETPATYGPKAVHLGAHFCNDGANDLTDVIVNIGDFSNNTPGQYPIKTILPTDPEPYEGVFSLTHGTSDISDATRYIGTIPAGECRTQYWMITYPQLGDNGVAVFGANTDFSDDLILDYDFWATATDSGTTLAVAADQTYMARMLRELSAAANKIWPNTTSKVPTEYLDAIEGTLGWRPTTGSETTEAGGVSTVSGVWYDFGVVNQGFDNDGDLIPDYNAWAQPVGDPALFDSACFKLVKTYGILIIKHNTGVDELIPFVDELYFTNIASDNTGMVGLVFYEFQGLNGTCTIQLSPYQEVASGKDNEKFNGDYGTSVGGFTSTPPSLTFTKGSDVPTVAEPGTIEYTMSATNIQNSGGNAISIGDPNIGSPLVFNDSIPVGTNYVFNSASTGNTLPSGLSVNVLYSSNNGTSWTSTKPTNQGEADLITDLQWWLDAPLDVGDTATVTFQTNVPSGYTAAEGLVVLNEACLSLGSSADFLCDDVNVYLSGSNSISGTVFEDDGTGGGTTADGVFDAGETGHLELVTATLYLDVNNDGLIDSGDIVWATTDTLVGDGSYSFPNLPDANFIVQLDTADPELFTGTTEGWGLTTATFLPVDLTGGGNSTGNDFGIAPALQITKNLIGTSPVDEGDLISYGIGVRNLLADTSGGSGLATCEYDSYATTVRTTTQNKIVNPENSVGLNPLDNVVTTTTGGGDGVYTVNNFNTLSLPEAVVRVELVFNMRNADTWGDDRAIISLADSALNPLGTRTLTPTELAALSSGSNTEFILDVTNSYNWDYGTANANGLFAQFNEDKDTNADGNPLYIDAIALRYHTDCGGGGGNYDINKTLSPIPLTDTYDTTYLEFVSSIPAPDNVNTGTGTITWNDVGPLNAGASRLIQVKFKTQLPGVGGQNNVLNTAFTNTAKFANGLSANTDTDDALVDIVPRVELSGRIWNDSTGSVTGWDNGTAQGYDNLGDSFISGVTVELFACLDNSTGDVLFGTGGGQGSKTCAANGGTWTVVDITTTDATGNYSFEGLSQGFYYVEVDSSTLPGTVTQAADPDDTNGGCGGACDNIWQNPASNFNGLIEVSAVPGDITNINFGYNVNPALYGNVWEDKNGNGFQGVGEPPISGWNVELQDGVCVPNSTCPTTVTDANGDYAFGNLTASTAYTITVTPADATWIETFESDSSIDNSITITLGAGEVSGSHDFAFQHTGLSSIGDLVFADWNGDGIKDANEEGIPGVIVNLYEDVDNDGILDLSIDPIITTTSSTGSYSFDNLPAGSFFAIVDETSLPTGYSQTFDPDEAGVCILCDAKELVSVNGLGTDNHDTADFGYVPSGLASIGDQVFRDANGDGLPDAGELGIANISVSLQVDIDGAGPGGYTTIKTTITDANGLYDFSNLPDGSYRVIVDSADIDLPNDTYGNDGVFTTATSIDVIISSGDVSSVAGLACVSCSDTIDFGYNILASIGDTIFQDDNGNAIQDNNEVGIAGVIVELFDPNGISLGTETTDANGNYLFTQLQPQFDINGDPLEFTVEVDRTGVLSTYTRTGDPDRDGIACADTSFGVPPTPNAPPLCDDETSEPLTYGTNYMGADFGYQPPGAFGDFVWNDINGDGIQDFGEPGLANVTISVIGTGTDCNPVACTTTTDNDGLYSFGNLSAGTYTVTVTDANSVLANYAAVSDPDGSGSPDVTTLEIDGSGTVTTVGGVACTNCELDVDFGYQLNGPLSLSGSVCFEDGDPDNGSCQDGTDSDVNDQTVYLYDFSIPASPALVGSTVTVNGDYSFGSLPAGDYKVVVGTTLAPLSFGALTTNLGNSPNNPNGTVTAVTDTGTSVIQDITLAVNTTLVDFAFNLTALIDFGDLPAPFATALSAGGAYHILDPINTLRLGPSLDSESDGAPSIDANGDGNDDSDGVGYGIISDWTVGVGGGLIQLEVAGSITSGYVVGWIDFNGDGDFTDTGEMVISSNFNSGFVFFNIDVPVGSTLDSLIYSRFRIFQNPPPIPALAYIGAYSKGEVEDYVLDFRVPGTIGDSVWLDEDGDGIEDIFEPGIANVTVELFTSLGVSLGTTTTDANGQYLFTGIYAGDYYVDIVSGIPTGLTVAPGTTDPSATFALANGEEKLDVDFGYIPTDGTSIIGDQVFVDANSDGVQNPGEIGIAGVTLDLIDSNGNVVDTVTTLTDGSYLFVNITPGDYTVSVTDTGNKLTGYTVTTSTHTPIDSITDPITLLINTIYTDADFGYVNPSLFTYTDRVWLDANEDGIFSGEQGIEGVTIDLIDIVTGDIVGTTVTSADGTFAFSGLIDLTAYRVEVGDNANVLNGLETTTTGATNGFVNHTVATSNQDLTNPNPSFGYYIDGGVSGLIWSDADGDGVRDAGEAAISGVTVELQGVGCISGSTCPTVVTGIDGTYLFDGYLPTGYTVVVNPVSGSGTGVAGYTQTGDPDVTLDDETSVTILAGTIDENNDFGYQNTALADISGNVFYDTDADGVYETNGNDGIAANGDDEYGIGSVTVELQDGSGNIIATTTAASDGTYSFPDLPAGDYTVVITDTNQIVSGFEATSGLDYRAVTLAAMNITDVDFGYVDEPQTASIGDYVWLDSDGDMVQDPDEPGLAGIGLILYEDTNNDGVFNIADDLEIATTTTDANGDYRFDALTSGTYFVDLTEGDLPISLTPTTFVTGISDLIALSEDEYFKDADFGFETSGVTGALSGLVWSDVDSDAIANNGEVGIGSVTISVYATNGALITTVDSNPDGTWMVTGLAAGDYVVKYDFNDLDATIYPNRLIPTNLGGQDTYSLTLPAGETINNLDFGFDPVATEVGALSGTVYNDLDGDSMQENPGLYGIELGIWDVSINLIDSLGNLVATTGTDLDGNYSFTGLIPGDYTVVITDINGTLDGLNPTEIFANPYTVAANATIIDVDAGFNSGNALGSIGNLVFLDTSDDGIYDFGVERGIPGVSLECWTDIGIIGTIEPGIDNLIRTVLTDDNGEYYCNSVPTGAYMVRVTDRDDKVLGYTSTHPQIDNSAKDDNRSNDPAGYAVVTASPNNTADFGYNGTLQITGTVFEDVNNNGSTTPNPDAGDINVKDAVLFLYNDANNDGALDSGDTVIAVTLSNGSGGYIFNKVPPGNYLIVPDASGTSVAGYSQTTQSLTNGIIAVTIGPDSSDNDFGFYNNGISTTPVTLVSFESSTDGKSTTFEWATETETGNLGFYVSAEGSDKQMIKITEFIPSQLVNSLEPLFYSETISGNQFKNIWITDVDIYGIETRHGPYELGQQYGNPDFTLEKTDWAYIRSENTKHQANRAQLKSAKAEEVEAIDIPVSKDGVYRVTYEEILAAGLDLNNVNVNKLRFELKGNSVPVYVNSMANNKFGPGAWIEFIGKKINNNIYTKTNLYRLSLSTSSRYKLDEIKENNTAFDGINTSVYYRASQYKDENIKYNNTARGGDPWYRDRVLAYGRDATLSYEFDISHLHSGQPELKYDIWGVTNYIGIVDHHIKLSLNDELLVDEYFDGVEAISGSFGTPENILVEGLNEVRLDSILEEGVRASLTNTNYIGIEYNSELYLTDDYLQFTGLSDEGFANNKTANDDLIFNGGFEQFRTTNSGNGILVKGLSIDEATVYSISGDTVERLSSLKIDSIDTGYSVTFADTSASHNYIVVANSAIITPQLIPVSADNDLLSGSADYLMISHPNFIDALAPLKAFHENRGLTVKVVDINDIYSQYSYGELTPDAIAAYIKEANDELNMKYIVLVGGDSYDYYDYLGYGSFSFIPSYYVQTDKLITYSPTDVPFVDFDSNNTPDVALGRLPVRTVAELNSIIDKTIQYASNNYKASSVFSADKAENGVNFALYSEGIINQLGDNWNVARAYLDNGSRDITQELLVNEINNGVSMVSYFGHSGPTTWSFKGLLGISNVEGLINTNAATVVVQWGCWNTYHVNPNAVTMAHKFLINENGAAAVLGATTLTKLDSDIEISRLFTQIASQPGISIGEALVQAKQELAKDHPEYLDVLLGYSILGDPAIQIGN